MSDDAAPPASAAPPAEPVSVPDPSTSAGPALEAPTLGEIVVEIPGVRAGDRTALAVPDELTAQEVRHLVNGFHRREALDRERNRLEHLAAALAVVEQELAINPRGVRGLALLLAEELVLARAANQPDEPPAAAPPVDADAVPQRPPRRVTARRVSHTAEPRTP